MAIFLVSHPKTWQASQTFNQLGLIHANLLKNQFISVPLRLGGIGSSPTEGYVEVLDADGQWGGVCDNR